ncbi:MAG TPA: class I SAM-dependent methyltransferase [Casimicrobiaceae bacterium]|nr:class I SAM-dependent methyltransferase [Casimicrobiaceae bacterium]
MRTRARGMRWLRAVARRPGNAGNEPEAAAETVSFRCNVCGTACRVAPVALSREVPSCLGCGSTVRMRTTIHLLTTELFGRSIALPDLPPLRDLIGIGLSDAPAYAGPLAAKLGYTNTFFHAMPRLDIAAVPDDRAAEADFIVASDVFEHVAPPVARAFANARRLLKPRGVMIFSVPYSLDADTVEHFPELHDWRLVETEGRWRLENRTTDGRDQVFTDLVFHGGPGTTLEMRLFSRAGLEREFAAAGFARMRVADQACPEFGIVWPEPWSVPMVAYA